MRSRLVHRSSEGFLTCKSERRSSLDRSSRPPENVDDSVADRYHDFGFMPLDRLDSVPHDGHSLPVGQQDGRAQGSQDGRGDAVAQRGSVS